MDDFLFFQRNKQQLRDNKSALNHQIFPSIKRQSMPFTLQNDPKALKSKSPMQIMNRKLIQWPLEVGLDATYTEKSMFKGINKLSIDYEDQYTMSGYPPKVCSMLLKDIAGPIRKKIPILDVGCGTGNVGEYLKNDGFFNISGIDCNKNLIEIAQSKKVYSRLDKILIGENWVSPEDKSKQLESEKYWKFVKEHTFYRYDKLYKGQGKFSNKQFKVMVYQKTDHEAWKYNEQQRIENESRMARDEQDRINQMMREIDQKLNRAVYARIQRQKTFLLQKEKQQIEEDRIRDEMIEAERQAKEKQERSVIQRKKMMEKFKEKVREVMWMKLKEAQQKAEAEIQQKRKSLNQQKLQNQSLTKAQTTQFRAAN